MTRVCGESLCGKVFGRLTVIAEAEMEKDKRQWLCESLATLLEALEKHPLDVVFRSRS